MSASLNVGICLADYLKKLKEEKPDFQLGAVSLNVMFKNNGMEYMTYSIAGDPTLSEDVMKVVCEEDLKDSNIVITDDDPVIIQLTIAMISKLTNGQINFTDVIYFPDEVPEEEAEVEAEPSCCSGAKCFCKAPNEEYSATLEELERIKQDILKYKEELLSSARKASNLFGFPCWSSTIIKKSL